jgi:hypothetical protein
MPPRRTRGIKERRGPTQGKSCCGPFLSLSSLSRALWFVLVDISLRRLRLASPFPRGLFSSLVLSLVSLALSLSLSLSRQQWHRDPASLCATVPRPCPPLPPTPPHPTPPHLKKLQGPRAAYYRAAPATAPGPLPAALGPPLRPPPAPRGEDACPPCAAPAGAAGEAEGAGVLVLPALRGDAVSLASPALALTPVPRLARGAPAPPLAPGPPPPPPLRSARWCWCWCCL